MHCEFDEYTLHAETKPTPIYNDLNASCSDLITLVP